MKYDYLKNVAEDVKEYIKENIKLKDYTREELEEKLYEDLWTEDSVTGNASGSYTFNTWEAEEFLCHNMDLVAEAYEEFGYDGIPTNAGAEAMDVIVRCYLLGSAISQALDDLM